MECDCAAGAVNGRRWPKALAMLQCAAECASTVHRVLGAEMRANARDNSSTADHCFNDSCGRGGARRRGGTRGQNVGANGPRILARAAGVAAARRRATLKN